jgi:DNA polymerase-3 subunit delta
MATDFRKLLQSVQKGQYSPVYLIDGEEPYYLDIITEYFEEKILQPAERDFNLTVMYGKDAEWADVVNACRRFPMFAERQVVILKDASQMKTLGELTGYVENPSPSTVFLIEHRFKKADGRSKLTKIIQDRYTYFTSSKIKDADIPHWILTYCEDQGLRIHIREAETLAASLGNDLQKIANEINKVRINMPEGEGELTAQLIQKYIGISHEYNAFQYPEALTGSDKDKLYRMLGYFVANPKAAPIPLLVGSLYNHFEKMYAMHYTAGKSPKDVAAAMKLKNEWAAKNYIGRPPYSLYQIEQCLQTLAEWSGKFVGIKSNISDVEWLKEFTARIELILSGVPVIAIS